MFNYFLDESDILFQKQFFNSTLGFVQDIHIFEINLENISRWFWETQKYQISFYISQNLFLV